MTRNTAERIAPYITATLIGLVAVGIISTVHFSLPKEDPSTVPSNLPPILPPITKVVESPTIPAEDLKLFAEIDAIKKLDESQFAISLVDAWASRGNAEMHLYKALCLSQLTPERTAACYAEFKKRKLSNGELVREFLTIAGKKDGRATLLKMMAIHPDGFEELDSLVHGWATTSTQESVDWVNALPDESLFAANATKGVMWGIAETSPEVAVKVFEQYGENPPDGVAYSIANSTVQARGIQGLLDLIALATTPSAHDALLAAGQMSAMKQPPDEYVKGMSTLISASRNLEMNFYNAAYAWSKSSPSEAMQWLEQFPITKDNTRAVSIIAQALSANSPTVIESWAAAHPEIIANPIIR